MAKLLGCEANVFGIPPQNFHFCLALLWHVCNEILILTEKKLEKRKKRLKLQRKWYVKCKVWLKLIKLCLSANVNGAFLCRWSLFRATVLSLQLEKKVEPNQTKKSKVLRFHIILLLFYGHWFHYNFWMRSAAFALSEIRTLFDRQHRKHVWIVFPHNFIPFGFHLEDDIYLEKWEASYYS